MDFDIELPVGPFEIVDARRFGLDSGVDDNHSALVDALSYCASRPRTMLDIPRGIYRFRSGDRILLEKAKDLLIEGNGSEFLFSGFGYFDLIGCENLRIGNLFIDWDWEQERLASLARVVEISEDRNTVDFHFPDVESFDIRLKWATMNQFDPITLTPGTENGKEYHPFQLKSDRLPLERLEMTGANRVRLHHDGSMKGIAVNQVFLIRHRNYDAGCVFHVTNCRHTTFDHITIFSAPGMGFGIGGGSHHIGLQDCRIVLRPGTSRRVTTTADAVHIADTCGYMQIENCEFSFMGDDGINIHDNISIVSSRVDETTCIASRNMPCRVGDAIRFRRSDFMDLDFKAEVVEIVGLASGERRIRFTGNLPPEVLPGAVLSNETNESSHYIIRGCQFHENRARGILLRSNHGLVEYNRFFRTQGPAIQIEIDVLPGLWEEGTGVDHLLVRNNTFESCSVGDWAAMIHFGVNIPGGKPALPVFRDIAFEGNSFDDFPGRSFRIAHAEDIRIERNRFANRHPRLVESPLRGSIGIEDSTNVRIVGNLFQTTSLVADPMRIDAPDGVDKNRIVVRSNRLIL